MAMTGAAIIGAQALGSASNIAGQIYANKQNSDLTGKQMRWQDANVGRAMDFEREMRSTAYQTSVDDMKKAGLNPMLLASKGFSPSSAPPSPGVGQAQPIKMENVMQGFASSINNAMDALRANAEIDKIRAQTDLYKAEFPMKSLKSKFPKAVLDFAPSVIQKAKDMSHAVGSTISSFSHPKKDSTYGKWDKSLFSMIKGK